MKNNIVFTQKDIDWVLSPVAIREQAENIFQLTLEGRGHFSWHQDKLDDVCEYVLETIKENYPDLVIPFHSRWGHFKANGVNRVDGLRKDLSSLSKEETCRVMLELVVTSVLLDAGAGADWSYFESQTNQKIARSEGLGVASFHLFKNGAFSSHQSNKWQADAGGLTNFKEKDLIEGFQVNEKNPLVGVEGRVSLLNSLGKVLETKKNIFKDLRVGNLYDYVLSEFGQSIRADQLLGVVLQAFGDIWPSRLKLGETSLGDVWIHSKLSDSSSVKSLVPFHKLSQWLTYSLMEPLMEAGIEITDLDSMTGLPEYRNGGLILDLGLINFRNKKDQDIGHGPDSDLIIEWRALTIKALDLIGDEIRHKLKMSHVELPLVKVLEGGTWHAGRKIAKEKRLGATPPLNIISDGTVF